MGYRSDIVIGVGKEVLVRHLLSPCIPSALMNEPYTTIDDVVYWRLEGWKWYEGYDEVIEILDFFRLLDNWLDEGVEKYLNETHVSLYGALRIGEDDDDMETWGCPGDFDIYLERSISIHGEH